MIGTCSSSVDILVAIPDFNADIVLIDSAMPGVNWSELCRSLRSDPISAGIKIVALSRLLM